MQKKEIETIKLINKMEQKDYLVREIEKIGSVFRAILNRLIVETVTKKTVEKTDEQLLEEIDFDIKYFLTLSKSEVEDYISKYEGLDAVNLELLAEIILQISITEDCDNKEVFLNKALQLFELCNLADKTYSFERGEKIESIKEQLPKSQ